MTSAINSDEKETVARLEDNRLRREAFATFISTRAKWQKHPPLERVLWEAFNAGYKFRQQITK